MKKIVIDGQIGPWQFSKQYVREMLKGTGTDEVEVNISSLGGSVDDAIDIHGQFAAHGNITILYTGFNASSATLLGLASKKIRMSENAFYLIHKPMFWVDLFDRMNEDDIDATIASLEKQKLDLAKITLVLARMYKDKTGMSIQEVLNLMKEEKWLNAEEAKKMGFVDEIVKPAQAVNYLEDVNRMAMVAASGYPVPGRTEKPADTPAAKPETINEESLAKKIGAQIIKFLTPKNTMKKQFKLVNTVLKVEKLDSTEEGIYLNEGQFEALEAELEKVPAAVAAQTAAETARTTAEADRDTAVAERTASITAFDTLDATVAAATTPEAKLEAVKALLAKKPAVQASGSQTTEDPDKTSADGVDWETLNNLPHMKDAAKYL